MIVKMGLRISKKSLREEGGSEEVPTGILSDNPLGRKLARWKYEPNNRDKDELQMIQYCMIEWTKGEIKPDCVHWLRYGLDKGLIYQAFNIYVRAKKPFNQEESDYIACWGETLPSRMSMLKVSESKEWD